MLYVARISLGWFFVLFIVGWLTLAKLTIMYQRVSFKQTNDRATRGIRVMHNLTLNSVLRSTQENRLLVLLVRAHLEVINGIWQRLWRNKSKESVFCFRHSRSIGARLEWVGRRQSSVWLPVANERGEADRALNSHATGRGRCGCRCKWRQLDPGSIAWIPMLFDRRRGTGSRFNGVYCLFVGLCCIFVRIVVFYSNRWTSELQRDPRDAQSHVELLSLPAPTTVLLSIYLYVLVCVMLRVARIPLHTGSLYYSFAGWLTLHVNHVPICLLVCEAVMPRVVSNGSLYRCWTLCLNNEPIVRTKSLGG